jgi:prepilin-type N-terminal cleavage/methylation domain-containing protein
MRRRGFTLVELLVVVAIVALLVAVLLPVLAQARQRSEATACANNVRQVVLAMSTYEADHKTFPLLHHPCYGMVPWDGMSLPKTWVDALLEQRYLLGPDIATRTLGVLACPEVEASERWIIPVHNGILSRSFTDYGYNWLANPGPPESDERVYQAMSFRGQRGRMARGDRKVLMTETWYRGGYWDSDGNSRVWSEGHGWYAASGGVYATGPGWEARHMRGRAVTVAYMSGAVELLYPPPWPADEAAAVHHPLSHWNFMYAEAGPEAFGW